MYSLCTAVLVLTGDPYPRRTIKQTIKRDRGILNLRRLPNDQPLNLRL